ncbi:MAG: 30S ribosomal protein S5 [bacterium]
MSEQQQEIKEKVVEIRRVTKVVKGGKKMGFRAVVVVGDMVNTVGMGIGKAAEVASAIRKGVEAAKRQLINVHQVADTLPHDIIGNYGASQIVLRAAPRGTGVIAGGAVRTVLELSGLKNVVAKSIGSNNPINMARATLSALKLLKRKDKEEGLRGKELAIKYVETE